MSKVYIAHIFNLSCAARSLITAAGHKCDIELARFVKDRRKQEALPYRCVAALLGLYQRHKEAHPEVHVREVAQRQASSALLSDF